MCDIEWFYRKEDIYLILKGQGKIKLSEKGMYKLVFCYNETRSLIKTKGQFVSSGGSRALPQLR